MPYLHPKENIMGKSKPLLFVDTNIFLDFYRAEGEAGLTLLKHLETVSESLIITDQIEVEFLNNRQRVISAALQCLKAPSIPSFTPAYLSDTKAAASIERNLQEIRKRIGILKERFARVLKDPGQHDPVFKAVKKVASEHTILNLKFAEADQLRISNFALSRFQRGFPPRKRQDDSIGDAINWEWILACAKASMRDVIIVSRDGDYGLWQDGKSYINDWLQQEFKDRVSPKRKVELSRTLAQALKRLSVPVTSAEEKEEQSIIKHQTVPPVQSEADPAFDEFAFEPFWPELMKRIGLKHPAKWIYLKEARYVWRNGNALEMFFEPEFHNHCNLIDNPSVHVVILDALVEMGIGDIQKINFEKIAPPHQVELDTPESLPPKGKEDIF
ncbi:MAG: hypothetical protein JWR69_2353 [Pedosphaera sp.]|nr:hypothetical protein [Pedosphaera sp.]